MLSVSTTREWQLAHKAQCRFLPIYLEECCLPASLPKPLAAAIGSQQHQELFPSYEKGLGRILRFLHEVKRTGVFEETFSCLSPDNAGWRLDRSGWQLDKADSTGENSRSIRVMAQLAPTKLLPQVVRQTAAIDIDLPGGPLLLRYRRRLQLSAPLGGEAGFRVMVDGETVDAASQADGEHANPWGPVPFRVGSRLTGRGWLGVEAGVACEAGGGAGARRDHGDRGRMSRAWRGGWPGRPRAEAQRGEAAHSGAPGRDGFGAGGRRGRALPLVRRLRASTGQQRLLPCDVPLPVRRRAGPGPAGARLPLPRPGRAEELRRPRPRRGYGRTGTSLCDGQVRGPGAVRQGRGALVRAAADQRGAERRHGPEQDLAGRPGRRAAAPHRSCATARSAGGRPRRGRA